MEIRILELTKRFKQLTHEGVWWAAIGHTDEMRCHALKNMTFSDLYSYNNALYKSDSEDQFHQTILLINPKDNSDRVQQSSDEEIWEEEIKGQKVSKCDGFFISVTRIHFSESVDLCVKFSQFDQELNAYSVGKGVCWRTYFTTELSDAILIGKSNSLKTLSAWALNVAECSNIGSSYTYFFISGKLIENQGTLEKSYAEEELDFLSIRFAFRENNHITECNAALDEVCSCLGQFSSFIVAGNEDAVICAHHIKAKKLIALYREWYNPESKVLKLFRDTITRIGVENNKVLSNEQSPYTEKRLEKYSKAVLRMVSAELNCMDKLESDIRQEWLRALVEETNALAHISNVASINDSLFLLLPSLNAFWTNVFFGNQALDDSQYLEFAELCIHTMEHVMRTEAHLSHRPEMRPLTYDMPIFVLEYARSFLLMLSQILTDEDNKSNWIDFLLAPRAVKNVSTEELFVQNGRIPGLLSISVPFSFMYQPKKLLASLCHEMAHYAGEGIRLRQRRYDLFLESVSASMLWCFFDRVSDPAGEFLNFLKEKFLRRKIGEQARAAGMSLSDEEIYRLPISEIVKYISSAVGNILELKDGYPEEYYEIVRSFSCEECKNVHLYCIPEDALKENFKVFAQTVDDLMISYKEAYADLCMLEFLNLRIEEYLEIVLPKINGGMLVRIFTALSASGKSEGEIISGMEHFAKMTEENCQDLDDILYQINCIKERNKYWLLNCHIKNLTTYLQECSLQHQAIGLTEKMISGQKRIKNLYDSFLKFDDKSSSFEEIIGIIDWGRKKTLEQLEQTNKWLSEERQTL